jgi:hypothetical protein
MQSVYLGNTQHFLLRARCNNAHTSNAFPETYEHEHQIPLDLRDHGFVDPAAPDQRVLLSV